MYMCGHACIIHAQTLTQPDLFKEAIQYVLPKSLLEPLYHCFYYFDAMNVSCQICTYMYMYMHIHVHTGLHVHMHVRIHCMFCNTYAALSMQL